MNTPDWLPFKYRDFYDVPRLIVVECGPHIYVLDSPYDEKQGEYSNHYSIYRLPLIAKEKVDSVQDWRFMPGDADLLGVVDLRAVRFDESKRSYLNREVLDPFL